jgi:hypothetical protein
MQSDEKVARNAHTAQNASSQLARSPIRPGESDLAPRGDSEKSSLPMSPILTAAQDSISKDLTIDSISRDSKIKGW